MAVSRLDRQLRIEGWDQSALDRSRIGVVGDDDLLASLFVLSAAALGVSRLVVVAPLLDRRLVDMALGLHPLLDLTHLQGFHTHPAMDGCFGRCDLLVDLSHYGLANKLLLERGFREDLPVLRGFCLETGDVQGLRAFSYVKGREWREIEGIISPMSLPGKHFDDGALDIIVAGMVLEEVRSILMHRRAYPGLVEYRRGRLHGGGRQSEILVVGAGALGNFVGLGLALSGFSRCTFMDPDVVELTNLNRQVFFHDAVGQRKSEVLSGRLSRLFGLESRAEVAYIQDHPDLGAYDVVLDCVDSFETRIFLSEQCQRQKKRLISGGTSPSAAQVVVYDPARGGPAPAELLGLAEIVRARGEASRLRERASCTYQPDPSVVMTNQIAAGFMVERLRMLLDGQEPGNVFYDSASDLRVVAGD
ncbi:MAG: ThiF family adenylyltransferase [Syntrophobacteraceae bacterium]|jgi:molybdopterin/thiamine biosynthesis adenylyltransferase|nr:ThiF family adenylyltransferase [Syntrophobacteraceae bacterium]